MSDLALRPRYHFILTIKAEEIRDALLQDLSRSKAFSFNNTDRHIIIKVNKEEKHIWSPEMDISCYHDDDGKTNVRILIGPAPGIWTLFMFLYSVAGAITLAGLIIGYSQGVIDNPTWGYWLIPAGLLMTIIIYLIALMGKKKAGSQMLKMRDFVNASVHLRDYEMS